jgi:hypothetical protein
MGQDRGAMGWKRASAGARMALTNSQIGLFMKQSQTGFMNSPGYRRSLMISRAAFAPGPPVTPPPGCVPAPQM